MGVDADRWSGVGLNLKGENRSDQEHRHAQGDQPAPGGHDLQKGRLPFKTLGAFASLEVQNIAEYQWKNNGGIALNVETRCVQSEFPPRDFFVWRGTGITTV